MYLKIPRQNLSEHEKPSKIKFTPITPNKDLPIDLIIIAKPLDEKYETHHFGVNKASMAKFVPYFEPVFREDSNWRLERNEGSGMFEYEMCVRKPEVLGVYLRSIYDEGVFVGEDDDDDDNKQDKKYDLITDKDRTLLGDLLWITKFLMDGYSFNQILKKAITPCTLNYKLVIDLIELIYEDLKDERNTVVLNGVNSSDDDEVADISTTNNNYNIERLHRKAIKKIERFVEKSRLPDLSFIEPNVYKLGTTKFIDFMLLYLKKCPDSKSKKVNLLSQLIYKYINNKPNSDINEIYPIFRVRPALLRDLSLARRLALFQVTCSRVKNNDLDELNRILLPKQGEVEDIFCKKIEKEKTGKKMKGSDSWSDDEAVEKNFCEKRGIKKSGKGIPYIGKDDWEYEKSSFWDPDNEYPSDNESRIFPYGASSVSGNYHNSLSDDFGDWSSDGNDGNGFTDYSA